MEPRYGPIGFNAIARQAVSAALLASALLICATDAAAQLTPEQLAHVEWIEETAISPDGQWVAYVRSLATGPGRAARGRARDLFLIPAAGGEPRRLVSADRHPGAPDWSPDGTLLAFLGEYPEQDRQVYAVPRDGGEPRALTRAPSGVRGFAFSPDGRSLAYLAPERVPDADADRQRKGYDAVVYGEPAAHVRLWVKDLSRGALRAVTPLDRTVRDFVWSPDGTGFALQITEGTDRISDRSFRRLYTILGESGELTPLARTAGPLGPMAWSPDGKRLAFVGATSLGDPTAQSVFVVRAGGGGPVDLTAGYEGSAVWVGWLGAERLLFGAIEGTRTVINAVDSAGGAVERLVGGGNESFVFLGVDIDPGLSLDARGRTFAAPMNTATHPDELYVGTTDGRELRRLTSHNAFIGGLRLARQEAIEWKSADGLRIEGILIHPLDERSATRYPLVVSPHGGPERASLNAYFSLTYPQSPGQVFAAHGYAVLYPNFRGSIGRGVAFSRANHRDLGGRELEDILAGIDHLIAQGLVDADRVAIQGHSHGGYLAALAAGLHSNRFKAAIASAPVTNYVSYTPSYNAVHTSLAHWDLWWYEHLGLLMDRSPVAHVHKNWTPLHLDHGLQDDEVPFLQSVELYEALRFAGAETRLVAYPREGHDYVEEAHRIDVIKRYLEWLERHVGTVPSGARSDGPREKRQ